MKKYIITSFIALFAMACTDSFLKEEMVSTITQDYLETEQGMDQLIVGTYNSMRVKWGYREGVFMFETGHDASRRSGDNDLSMFSASKWSASGDMGTYSNEFMGFASKNDAGFLINHYPIIDNANKAINAIRSGKAPGKYATDAKYADLKLSEALFTRAYSYYNLNTIFGDIYFTGVSSTSLPANYLFKRTPSEELYQVLIGDLRFAVDHLSDYQSSGDDFGRATKTAAAHLLSKLYLHRAQGAKYGTTEYGRKADGSIDNTNPNSYLGMLYKGSVATDLDSCVYYASMVIDKHPLANNFWDLFNHPLGDYSNENNPENVLNAIFSANGDNYRYGVRAISAFGGNYQNEKYGIRDWCWEYPTKPNFNMHNSDFGFDVFTDKIHDSRYQKSFHLEFKTAINTAPKSTVASANGDYFDYKDLDRNTTYLWTEAQAQFFNSNILPTYNRESWGAREAVVGEHKMGTGDLAFAILENTKETAISVEEADAQPFVLYARWMKDGSKYYYRPEIVASGNTYSFKGAKNHYGLEKSSSTGVPTNKKYDDPNRLGNNSAYGTRDVPVMRSAEAYLIRAEAYGRKGQYSKAIDDINVLRKRAAFKSGEQRNEVLARLYPGSESLMSAERQWPYEVLSDDSYDKIKVDASYWDGGSDRSKAENYPPSASSELDRFVHFIYNEYLREFNQEEIYYEGVHHAGIQAARIQWRNQMGANPNNTAYETTTWDKSDNINGVNGQTGQPKGGFQNYMTLKPLPQSLINMLTDEKNNLLDDQGKKEYQNYGY